MSAFLGPIHIWLFRKIVVQNELTNKIIERMKSEKDIKISEDYLNSTYGKLEEGELENIIDERNIHGWLQERISLVENRLASVVSSILENRVQAFDIVLEEACKFGIEQSVNSTLSPKDIYEYFDSILLNGMPCDRVNDIISEDSSSIIWEQRIDIHKQYWDMVKVDVTNYYCIRNAFILGMLSTSDVRYTEIGTNKYELRKE